MRYFINCGVAGCLLIGLTLCFQAQAAENWVPLFNGKDLDGWTPKFKGHAPGENYKNTFRVENGVLKVSYGEYTRFNGEFGHLFWKEKYSHYRLRVEYRLLGEQLAGGASWAFRNNGVMIHSESAESMDLNQDFPTSLEVQLLGGTGTPRSTANLCTPGTHVVMDGKLVTQHCTLSKSKTYDGDQWVTVEIEVRGNKLINHIIDGETVLSYGEPQLDSGDAHARKLIEQGSPKMLGSGFIAIQAETHPTEFRKIEIMKLEE
jgi:hypothetical protein